MAKSLYQRGLLLIDVVTLTLQVLLCKMLALPSTPSVLCRSRTLSTAHNQEMRLDFSSASPRPEELQKLIRIFL